MTKGGARHRGISWVAGRFGAPFVASAVALTLAENSNAQTLPGGPTDTSAPSTIDAAARQGSPSDAAARQGSPIDEAARQGSPSAPPPLEIPYVQFGIAITTEFVTDGGKMCAVAPPPAPQVPTCILGSGGGVVARVGRRSAGPWYFGGAYEMSKQDPSNLYRFATLQQLRAEARWYLDTGRDIYPYATAGSGVATYGDEWNIDTYGPVETLGIGVEAQVSRRTVVGLAVSYRAIIFNDHLTNVSTYESGASLVQIVGIDLFVEERAPIVSALSRPSQHLAKARRFEDAR